MEDGIVERFEDLPEETQKAVETVVEQSRKRKGLNSIRLPDNGEAYAYRKFPHDSGIINCGVNDKHKNIWRGVR